MNPTDPRPAHRQQAETVASLFAEVKAHEHRCELAGRETLDAARDVGKALLRAKELCPSREWLATLEKFWPDSRYKAARYIRIAENWRKIKRCANITEALAFLAHKTKPEAEKTSLADDESCGARATDPPQDEDPQGDGEEDVDTDSAEPEDDGAAEERAKLADMARGRDLVGQAMRAVMRARELLSEAYQTAAREALEHAATSRMSLLHLRKTDGIVRHGKTEAGADVGIPLMTNEAVDELLRMTASARYVLEVPADEPDERAEPERPGAGDGADDDAG